MIADPRDAAVTVGLIGSFALLVTMHVALLFGLVRQKRFGGAALGLVLPPLAPIWAWRTGMRTRAVIWAVAFVFYGVCFLIAR